MINRVHNQWIIIKGWIIKLEIRAKFYYLLHQFGNLELLIVCGSSKKTIISSGGWLVFTILVSVSRIMCLVELGGWNFVAIVGSWVINLEEF